MGPDWAFLAHRMEMGEVLVQVQVKAVYFDQFAVKRGLADLPDGGMKRMGGETSSKITVIGRIVWKTSTTLQIDFKSLPQRKQGRLLADCSPALVATRKGVFVILINFRDMLLER